jgi:hypothetical protein
MQVDLKEIWAELGEKQFINAKLNVQIETLTKENQELRAALQAKFQTSPVPAPSIAVPLPGVEFPAEAVAAE